MKWGVVRFPGSLDDADALWALNQVMGQEARALWHKDASRACNASSCPAVSATAIICAAARSRGSAP